MPDDDWGESLRGFVVLRPDAVADEDELRRWCKDGLADFKCPKRFLRLGPAPEPDRKVLKRELREAARLG